MSWNNKQWIVFQWLTTETVDLCLIPNTGFIRLQGLLAEAIVKLLLLLIVMKIYFFNYFVDILHLFQLRGLSNLFRVNVTSPVGAKKQKRKVININVASYFTWIKYCSNIWILNLNTYFPRWNFWNSTSRFSASQSSLKMNPQTAWEQEQIMNWNQFFILDYMLCFSWSTLLKQADYTRHHSRPKTPSASPMIRQLQSRPEKNDSV